MTSIGVLNKGQKAVVTDILHGFKATENILRNMPQIRVYNKNQAKTAPQVLIVHEMPPQAISLNCGFDAIIVNSDDEKVLNFAAYPAQDCQIITYGFNQKAAVTASSLLDGSLVICIQRAMTTIFGGAVFPQEILIKTDPASHAFAMAAIAAALVCGMI